MARRPTRPAQPPLSPMIRQDRMLGVRPLGRRPLDVSDVYHRLMRAGWGPITLVFALSFLAFNLTFGLLYWLDPDGIHWGANPVQAPRFWRCVFFSIQTVATIGYGNMYPVTLYANLIVVVEITLGILFFALATGIVFARFSRPTARILFSEVAAVARVDGVPTLMLRAANQRHNLIFEAHASLSLLVDEEAGGSRMRRYVDLPLVRTSNPAFALTWTLMHPITPDSPLRPWLDARAAPPGSEIVVVLSGTDSASGQTIYGRWAYHGADIRWNARFADILGVAEDGARTIDYDRFHQTEPADG